MMPVRMISANYHNADDDNGDHGGSVDDNALYHTPPGLAVMAMVMIICFMMVVRMVKIRMMVRRRIWVCWSLKISYIRWFSHYPMFIS